MNITNDRKMFLYIRERLEMIHTFAVYFPRCRPIHSDEFHVMAKMMRDTAVDVDGDELDIIKNIFREICMDNKFI